MGTFIAFIAASRRERGLADFLAVLEEADPDRWVSIEHVKDHDVENFAHDAARMDDALVLCDVWRVEA